MTSDLDIYRSAQVLIREHGEDAALEGTLDAAPPYLSFSRSLICPSW